MKVCSQVFAAGLLLLVSGPVLASIIPVQTMQQASRLLESTPAEVVSLLTPYLEPHSRPRQIKLGQSNQAMGHKLIAKAQLKLNQPAEALSHAQAGNNLLVRNPDSLLAIEMRFLISQALWRLDRQDEALAQLAEVAASLRSASSPLATPLVQQALMALSHWRQSIGDLAGATIAANLAANSAERWGDADAQLASLTQWINLFEQQGLLKLALDKRLAHQRVSRAAQRWDTLGNSLLEGSVLYFRLDKLQRSRFSAQAAADIALTNDLPVVLARALIQLGKVAVFEAEMELALVHFHNALELMPYLDKVQQGQLQSWISTAYLREGRLQLAEQFSLQARRSFTEAPDATLANILSPETLLAQIYLVQHRLQESAVILEVLDQYLDQLPDWLCDIIIRMQAELKHLRGDDAGAYSLLSKLSSKNRDSEQLLRHDLVKLQENYQAAFTELEQFLELTAPRSSGTPFWPIGLAVILLAGLTGAAVLTRHHHRYYQELDQLRYQATHDPGTQLLNFNGLVKALNERFPKAERMMDRWYSGDLSKLPSHARYSIALFKLESVEQIFLDKGYHFGSRLEKALGEYLKNALSEEELLGITNDRIFCFFTPCGAEPDPLRTARRVKTLVSQFVFEGERLQQRLAIGMLSYPLFPSATHAISSETIRPILIHARAQALKVREETDRDSWSYLKPIDCFPGDLFVGDPDVTSQVAIEKGYLRLESGILD